MHPTFFSATFAHHSLSSSFCLHLGGVVSPHSPLILTDNSSENRLFTNWNMEPTFAEFGRGFFHRQLSDKAKQNFVSWLTKSLKWNFICTDSSDHVLDYGLNIKQNPCHRVTGQICSSVLQLQATFAVKWKGPVHWDTLEQQLVCWMVMFLSLFAVCWEADSTEVLSRKQYYNTLSKYYCLNALE